MHRLIRFLWITGWYSFAIFIVISAVGLSSARFLLPFVKDYNNQIESEISTLIGQPIKIGGLDAEWRGFGPKLVLQNVVLLNEQNGSAIANFDKAFLGFDLFSLIFHGQLGLNNISVSGVNLYVERHLDGTFSIAGAKKSDDTDDTVNNKKLEDWVLKQVRLNISETNFYWHDRKLGNKPVLFSDVDISLKNDNDRHQLQGTINLPKNIGKKITFALDMYGNPLHTDINREGKFYIKGTAIKLSQFLQYSSSKKFNIKSLSTDFELWSTWEKGALVKITGDIDAKAIHLSNTTVANNGKELKLQRMSGQAVWQRNEDGWKLNISNFSINRNGTAWPPTSATIKSSSLRPDISSAVEAKFSFLRIEDIAYLALFAADTNDTNRAALVSQNPSGELKDVFINYRGSNPENPEFNFEANFNGVTLFPNETIPGIHNFSGSITTNNNSGSLALDTNSATLFMPQLFRAPIPIDKLTGVLDWSKYSSSWRLSSENMQIINEDLNTTVKLTFDFPANGLSPFLSLATSFREGKGDNVSRYVPYKLTPKLAIDWIDRSILGGEIISGNAVFHGRLADFPFEKGEGKFELHANTKNVEIDYAPHWPALKKLELELDFLNKGMTVIGHAGKILSSNLFDTVARIENLAEKPAIMNITSKIEGPTKDKLDFLRSAPKLKNNFEDSLKKISINGQSLLELDLSIPLTNNPRYTTKTKGNVALTNNSINIKGQLGEVWSNLNGHLFFSKNDLTAENLSGLFFNYPAKLEILTKHTQTGSLTRFKTKSTLNPQLFVKQFIPSWGKFFHGNTKWAVNLDIPHSDNTTFTKPVLRIQTQLENIEIDLLEPLNKKLDEKVYLNVGVEFSKTKHTFDIQYGPSISSIMEFSINDSDDISLSRGTININNNEANPLPLSGISVVSNNVKRFLFDHWVSLLEKTPEFNSDTKDENSNPLNWLSKIKANIGELKAFHQTYHSVNLDAIKTDRKWEAIITSDELSGKISLPIDLSIAPISMKLDKLMLFSDDKKEKEEADKNSQTDHSDQDPRDWPAMIINSKRFVLDDTEYGQLLTSISKRNNGLHMDNLELTTPTNSITGTGTWIYDGTKHKTQIELKSAINNIGKTMANMGFADTIKNGQGNLSMDLNWPSIPSDVSASIINGTVNLDFKNGQLLDINPGAGRIFGLLSLQSLPRRLMLDFRDVFSKGFSFDQIKGKFNLEKGDAYTSDLHLLGPAGRIEVSGRTGFVDEDYDQLVTVIPDAAASVPLLTVLAGAEPITALVTWTLKNVFQSQIDKALSFQYTITGNWDNPKIVKIGKPQSPKLDPQIEDEEEP
ncbi:MAG: TIGR02099 family protein [Gammaproteobacteria bacterium]|nr:TIGR02099 family protein [Gammaproteobacteria bacterium]